MPRLVEIRSNQRGSGASARPRLNTWVVVFLICISLITVFAMELHLRKVEHRLLSLLRDDCFACWSSRPATACERTRPSDFGFKCLSRNLELLHPRGRQRAHAIPLARHLSSQLLGLPTLEAPPTSSMTPVVFRWNHLSSTENVSPSLKMTPRSTTFCNSRMFPGQS